MKKFTKGCAIDVRTSIESKTLSEKVGPSMFDMSVKDFEIAKSCKQNLELLLAKEENKPYIEGLVRELGL